MWGKMTTGESPYPLLAHLADTAASGLALWDCWLAPNLVNLFSEMFGSSARERFALVTAAHDLGKANPLFQGQLLSKSAAAFEPQRRALENLGFTFPASDELRRVRNAKESGLLRHEVFTWHLARQAGISDWAARAVAAHHGRFHDVDKPTRTGSTLVAHRRLQDNVRNGTWGSQATSLYHQLASALGVTVIDPIPPELTAGIVAIAGAVSLADWLASTDESLDDGRSLWPQGEIQLHSYIEQRASWFKDHLASTVGLPLNPAGEFEDLFGFSPNSCQCSVIEQRDAELAVVMVPMGRGKTEAALARHKHLDRGLYFALPTMATADAMFKRVDRFYGKHSQPGALIHSRSILNAFYRLSGAETDVEISSPGGLTAQQWLQGRHRPLLAPVAVGTCDRVLAGALPAKWLTMRLLAVANKHLVVDEVHTFDSYQDQLLVTLLTWIGFCKAPVTLLSATLATPRLDGYLDAWWEGRHRFTGVHRPTVTAPYPGLITARAAHIAATTIEADVPKTVSLVTRLCEPDGMVNEIIKIVKTFRLSHPAATIGVMVNTVDNCISVGEALEPFNPLVLHSRMTAAMRRDRADELITRLGPTGPGGGVIVGTQVIEASLDIDVDLLVTQLAPTPSLLQRSGRLWRHSALTHAGWDHPVKRAAQRPASPTCIVVAPKEISREVALPYSVAELARTFKVAVRDRTTWEIPGDVQQLMNDSHISSADLVSLEADDPNAEPLEEHLAGVASRTTAANRVRINWADHSGSVGVDQLPALTAPAAIGDEAYATRYQDLRSITVLVVGTGGWDAELPNKRVSLDTVIKMLDATIPVSGRMVRQLENIGTPLSKDLHPLLEGVVAVHLSELTDIELHPRFGLRFLEDHS